jgi:uncharacterized protein (DUF1697 family)
MAAIVSLLRAVNLAGRSRIDMAALRALYGSLELREARTYVQSGNVIFATAERDLARLARRIEAKIAGRFGFRTAVILRTAAEMSEVIAHNPFPARQKIEPSRLLVFFLDGAPGQEACATLLARHQGPEEVHLIGREVYIHYKNGIGRSKLTAVAMERALGMSGTGRNWNTVKKLDEMATELAGAVG